VVRKAAELNHPVTLTAGEMNDQSLAANHSFLALRAKHVVLDTIKAALDGEGTILRLYESTGGRETVTLELPFPSVKAYIVNLLEEEHEEIPVVDGKIVLDFRPYQIISVKCV
jgi:alpha-mannosidase